MEPFAGDPSFRPPPQAASPLAGVGSAGKIHVAVGKSMAKTLSLLQWSFRRFGCKEVTLLYVHQPSPTIPTLLGKLPTSQANEYLLSAHRREEREAAKKLLQSYLSTCYTSQVQASIIMIEKQQIGEGIVELVARHAIQKLVMGSTQDSFFKVKGGSSKATFTAKNAPPFCEIWFVSKSKHVWTREACESRDSFHPVLTPVEPSPRKTLKCSSLYNENGGLVLSAECFRSIAFIGAECLEGNAGMVGSSTNSTIAYGKNQTSSSSSSLTSTPPSFTSPVEINSKEELEMEPLHSHLKKAMLEALRIKKQAFAELLRREELEREHAETCIKIKDFVTACANEIQLREKLGELVRTAKMQQEELAYERDGVTRELRNGTRTIALLNLHAQEVACHLEQAAGYLEHIQSSIEALKLEIQKCQCKREESGCQLHRWRSTNHARYLSHKKYVDFGYGPSTIIEFSVSDLQTATCDFSESFMIAQGGYGCIYKGELLSRSVAIKRLHPNNFQGRSEFEQEVYVLGKLRHPHLVTLIGVCSEALSLVYEYLPKGSLCDHLFKRNNNTALSWQVRTRTIVGIVNALLFLHSCQPEAIIHGDLKPEVVFFDSDFNCKIVSFGVCQLVPEKGTHVPLFSRKQVPKGACSHADPEYQRTGVLTIKSDVYSFGIVVLQLLTGRPPILLANEVRRAISSQSLSSILDPTAGEWPPDVARRLAEFGLQCSEVNSRDRPDLTPEVARELQHLYLPDEQPIPPFFLCPILQEIMHDPQVAADGFTYEGDALRGWLRSGRETSPMTNLRLEHLNLTPNHSLRLAIQDWLCSCSSRGP